jgi:hypothetical protein
MEPGQPAISNFFSLPMVGGSSVLPFLGYSRMHVIFVFRF